MNELSVFNFESNTVRTVIDTVTGESLFVGKDVCDILEYVRSRDAMAQHCKGAAKYVPIQTSGGVQKLRVLTEADVLRLVISSNLPAGKPAMDALLAQVKDIKSVMRAINDFEVPDDLQGMYVYAIRNTVTGNVKLGISRNPAARLKQLQTGNECKLELVATREATNKFTDERTLHIEHAATRLSGEWFSGVDANTVLN